MIVVLGSKLKLRQHVYTFGLKIMEVYSQSRVVQAWLKENIHLFVAITLVNHHLIFQDTFPF